MSEPVISNDVLPKAKTSRSFTPYIPPEKTIPELTPLPLIVGTLLGIIFGASSLYLVLRVGLTVSASIPVAVISITLFRILSKLGGKPATILENNIVQTTGSAGESIAFGIGVTMPAILILGFDLEITRVMLVAVLGGLLGILMMIPLRRALIVQQHGILKYPEGTACAEVLKAGDAAATAAHHSAGATKPVDLGGAKTIFYGFGIGLVYKALMVALKGWKDVPEKIFGPPFKSASVATEVSPELLGVGYIIGPRLASIMCAGGVLAYLVFIPAIAFFGQAGNTILTPGTKPISEMTPNDIRSAYILYIGAGAVAAGGIISVIRSLPIIWHGIQGGLSMMGAARRGTGSVLRTDQDLSFKFVFVGILLLIVLIVLSPPLHMNLVGALLIIVFGFLFATVSSRLTGEIGSSSNPISGMTVATLLLTCLVFLTLGWTSGPYFVTALSVGAIVCIASSNAGTTSQDLKTGFLVGATPRLQQIAILVGALASALVLGPILLQLNQAATVYVPRMTLEPATTAAPLSSAILNQLPPAEMNSSLSVPGSYRLLRITPNQGVEGVEGLTPGDYWVNTSGQIFKVQENFPAGLRAPDNEMGEREQLRGPQAAQDTNTYRVWHRASPEGGPASRFLVKENDGTPVYLVDPGINGIYSRRPDGTTVTKFEAPKATLMSYIIKGILNQQLPWGLVLLGVMIAIVLEMSGIPSLAFAVGVYLPLSSSSPIFVGGMVRWLVDRYVRNKFRGTATSEEELAAEGDRSPGVLMASGYIAGGAIAGILIAFVAGVLSDMNQRITNWSTLNNPFFEGPNADWLALLPFALLVGILYFTGREILFARKAR